MKFPMQDMPPSTLRSPFPTTVHLYIHQSSEWVCKRIAQLASTSNVRSPPSSSFLFASPNVSFVWCKYREIVSKSSFLRWSWNKYVNNFHNDNHDNEIVPIQGETKQRNLSQDLSRQLMMITDCFYCSKYKDVF